MRFIKDGKTEYHTPGDSRVDSCIYSLLGRDIESGFLSAESSDEAVAVKGFVSSPSSARGNRSYQFFFVNGRVIRSLLLQSALEQAYKNTLPSGRFPSCVLYITTKPGDVDVNVHPAKTEVKFVSDKQVFDGVYYAAMGALEKNSGNKEQGIGYRDQATEYHSSTSNNGFKTMQADEFRKSYVSEPSVSYEPLYGSNPERVISALRSHAPDITSPKTRTSGLDYISTPSFSPSLLPPPSLRIIGEALNVYIIVEYEDSIWFIDKHAVHERIHFDALKSSSYKPMSESLLAPVICRPGHEEASLLIENAAFLEELGFTIDSFGEESVAIRHIPAEINIGDTESVLSEICTQLGHSGSAVPAQRDSIYKTIACKAAIKAGSSSSSKELETLAARVMSGEISHCPHGRPVAFEIPKSTLDKGFGRI